LTAKQRSERRKKKQQGNIIDEFDVELLFRSDEVLKNLNTFLKLRLFFLL
jgi:hypothetical protein